MSRLKHVGLSLVLLTLATGCQKSQPTIVEPSAPSALSVEEWHQLPVEEKYDPSSFERLRLNPQLKSEAAWQKFFKGTVVVERKKDIPGS